MATRPRKRIFDLRGESHYQSALLWCDPGMSVELVREPDNPHDPNAIAVKSDGEPIGYIARAEATELAPYLDDGHSPDAKVHEIRGCMSDFPSIGCRVAIRWEGDKPRQAKALDPEQEAFREKLRKSGANQEGGCLGAFALGMTPFLLLAGYGVTAL